MNLLEAGWPKTCPPWKKMSLLEARWLKTGSPWKKMNLLEKTGKLKACLPLKLLRCSMSPLLEVKQAKSSVYLVTKPYR